MKGLKILWFNWRCWLNPDMGGAEVFTREVAKRIVEAGNEITLFTSGFKGCKNEEVLDGVRIVRSGGKYSVYSEARKFYRRRFSRESYDLVVDEINTRPFFAPSFVGGGEKVIALIHQLAKEYWFYEVPFPLSHLGFYYLENRWLKRYVNVPTITVSESSRSDLINLGFQRISVVSEGLNFKSLSEIPEKEDKPVVVYVGRLKRAKRPDHAIKALAVVKRKVPKAELWVFGSGPFRAGLEKLAGEGVRFFGHLGNEERRGLIGRSWVLVNPSVREGWGLNIIEANALGVPAVAYDVPGLRDSVMDSETGLLTKAGDIELLADKLVTVLSDSPLRGELSRSALEYSRGFSWDRTAAEFMMTLRSCL